MILPGLAGPSLQATAPRRSTAQSRVHTGRRPDGLNAGIRRPSLRSSADAALPQVPSDRNLSPNSPIRSLRNSRDAFVP